MHTNHFNPDAVSKISITTTHALAYEPGDVIVITGCGKTTFWQWLRGGRSYNGEYVVEDVSEPTPALTKWNEHNPE